MTRRIFALVTAGTAATALSVATVSGPADASPEPERLSPASQSKTAKPAKSDDKPDPRRAKQQKLRKATVDKYIKGEAKTTTINGTRVLVAEDGKPTTSQKSAKGGAKHKTPKKRYVQYEPTEKSNIFTVLSQFGTKTRDEEGGEAGPKRNELPKPDRKYDGTASDDNTTNWVKNFNRKHYQNMMFSDSGESMRTFYQAQSLGRHYIQGDVSPWVTVPYNEARYGSNKGVEEDPNKEAERSWSFVGDSLTAWYKSQQKAGKSKAQIQKYLKQFDVWDRYDYDGDGDFNEADGYIDHFQAIHAGEGEEAGGGAQGEDAIWSHRWAVQTGDGQTGPGENKAGGVQIGDTGIWVRDYTTEPENGGLGVFAHEYGHDLGLPDLYDTAGGDNTVAYWSLMASGSWLGHGKDTIGTTPGYMGAWDKVQLGWADVKTLQHGNSGTVNLGPADQDNAKKPQAAAVSLPDKTVTTPYNKPKSGEYEWWSGRGDDRNASLARDLDLTGKKSASVSTAIWYDIEKGYDYLYGQVSTDGGKTWKNVGDPISGTKTEWGTADFDLSEYAGKKVQFRFLYQTDGGVNEAGAFLDDISVTIDGKTTTDDVESADSDWTAKGFTRMNGTDVKEVSHYYLAEYRRYNGYDATLKTGPYNFGFKDRPDFVEHFPYQEGMLVWYVDNEYVDNNVSDHPGHGLVLPVDANATPMRWPDGKLANQRIQPFDATFGLKKSKKFTLHKEGMAAPVKSRAAVKQFDDTNPNRYWFAGNPQASTKVAGSGTKIKVLKKQGDGLKIKVDFKQGGGMLRTK